jgi:lysophospholipase L1-like esterase
LFGNNVGNDSPRLGLSGFTLTANTPRATASLTADTPDFMFDKFYLCGLTGPGMGDVAVKLGSTERHLSFSSAHAGVACFEVQASSLVQSVIVETLAARPVSLTSWMTQRSTGGVILSNLGVVGARFEHFARTDDRVIEAELRQLRPDLLVVAYGTNEGYLRELDLAKVKAIMINQIDRVRRLLGYDVPVLLLGPPDVLKSKSRVSPDDVSAQITSSCANGMTIPENVSRVRSLQRDLANQAGFAFWDWQGAMGGPCSSVRWVANAMQMKAHVHLTATGGSLLGKALADDLEQAKADGILE